MRHLWGSLEAKKKDHNAHCISPHFVLHGGVRRGKLGHTRWGPLGHTRWVRWDTQGGVHWDAIPMDNNSVYAWQPNEDGTLQVKLAKDTYEADLGVLLHS